MAEAFTPSSRTNFRWVRAASGTTYVCPAEALRGLHNPTEEQLRAIGVDESLNPQND